MVAVGKPGGLKTVAGTGRVNALPGIVWAVPIELLVAVPPLSSSLIVVAWVIAVHIRPSAKANPAIDIALAVFIVTPLCLEELPPIPIRAAYLVRRKYLQRRRLLSFPEANMQDVFLRAKLLREMAFPRGAEDGHNRSVREFDTQKLLPDPAKLRCPRRESAHTLTPVLSSRPEGEGGCPTPSPPEGRATTASWSTMPPPC